MIIAAILSYDANCGFPESFIKKYGGKIIAED